MSWAEQLQRAGWWVTLRPPGSVKLGYAIRGTFMGDVVRMVAKNDGTFLVLLLDYDADSWPCQTLESALLRAERIATASGGWSDAEPVPSTAALHTIPNVMRQEFTSLVAAIEGLGDGSHLMNQEAPDHAACFAAGLLAGLAFGAGVISGGRLTEIIWHTGLDPYAWQATGQGMMEEQDLWPQQKAPEPEPDLYHSAPEFEGLHRWRYTRTLGNIVETSEAEIVVFEYMGELCCYDPSGGKVMRVARSLGGTWELLGK